MVAASNGKNTSNRCVRVSSSVFARSSVDACKVATTPTTTATTPATAETSDTQAATKLDGGKVLSRLGGVRNHAPRDTTEHVMPIAETGVVANRNWRVLDSTVLDDAVQRQDTIRRVRKLAPSSATCGCASTTLQGVARRVTGTTPPTSTG